MKPIDATTAPEPFKTQTLPVSQFEVRLAEELDERIEFAAWGVTTS